MTTPHLLLSLSLRSLLSLLLLLLQQQLLHVWPNSRRAVVE